MDFRSMCHLKAELFRKKSFENLFKFFRFFFLNLSGDFYIFFRPCFVTLCVPLFIFYLHYLKKEIYKVQFKCIYIYLATCIMNIQVSFYDGTILFVYLICIFLYTSNIILFSHFSQYFNFSFIFVK